MAFFKSLPEDCGVRHILRMNKPVGRALLALHEALMRSESPLSAGERELVAAYVSGLNRCQYCLGVHGETARQFGLSEGLLQQLLLDPENAAVDPRMKPLLEYVRLLTQAPDEVVQADADRVLAAGWSERALHDAILVTCLFNFMNRLLDGHGCKGDEAIHQARGKALKDSGYAALLKSLE